MALSKVDVENIEGLYNTEELILGVYNELIQLEVNNQYSEMDSRYEYLKTLYLIEDNMFKEFDNFDKYQEIVNYIDNRYGNNGNIIVQRINNKLNRFLMDYKYSKLNSKQDLSTQDLFERGNIVTFNVRQFIYSDINNIFRAYLINNIKSSTNEEIKSFLIQYKFYNIFSNLNDIDELDNVCNNSNVFLSYNALFQVLIKKNVIPDFILDFILSDYINSILNFMVNDLTSIPDKDLFDPYILTQAYVLSFYIKSCLLFADEKSINIFKKQIDDNVNNSISKQILMGSIDEMKSDDTKPKIYYVSFLK